MVWPQDLLFLTIAIADYMLLPISLTTQEFQFPIKLRTVLLCCPTFPSYVYICYRYVIQNLST